MVNPLRITKGELIAGKLYTESSLIFSDESKISSYLEPIYGQSSRITAGTVTPFTQSVYRNTGAVTANFDSSNSLGIAAGTANPFSLRNITNETRLLRFFASFDARTTSGNNKILGIKLAKNGTPINETECRAFTGNAEEGAKLVSSWMIKLAPNDEVALFLANHSGTEDIQIDRGRILASGVFRQEA